MQARNTNKLTIVQSTAKALAELLVVCNFKILTLPSMRSEGRKAEEKGKTEKSAPDV
jgi:hypothetical protein